jgi:hypothetical protein
MKSAWKIVFFLKPKKQTSDLKFSRQGGHFPMLFGEF